MMLGQQSGTLTEPLLGLKYATSCLINPFSLTLTEPLLGLKYYECYNVVVKLWYFNRTTFGIEIKKNYQPVTIPLVL